MKKSFKKFFAVCISLALTVSLFAFSAFADRAIIQCSTTQTVGATFNVTFKFEASSVGAVDGNITYDASKLEFVSAGDGANKTSDGNIVISYFAISGSNTQCTFTVTFRTKATGNASVSATGEITKFDETFSSRQTAGVTVKIVDAQQASGNANLKSLKLSAGTLSPAFNADVTNYTVNVDYSVTKCLVTAVPADSSATHTVEGSANLNVGANTRTVVVTAANGAVKRYVLKINRAAQNGELPPETTEPETNPYSVTIGDVTKILAREYSSDSRFFGSELSEAEINGAVIPVLQKSGLGIIVYATDESGDNGAYYLYKDGVFSEIKPFEFSRRYLALELPDGVSSPEGFYQTQDVLNGQTLTVFKYNDPAFNDYFVFYGESEDGVLGYYRYSRTDNSIQRAMDFEVAKSAVVDTPPNTVATGLAGLSVKGKLVLTAVLLFAVLLVVLIVVNIVSLTHRDKNDEFDSFEDEIYFDDQQNESDDEEYSDEGLNDETEETEAQDILSDTSGDDLWK